MKKTIIFSIVGIAFIAVIIMFAKKNRQPNEVFETELAFKATIVEKTVATGKVIPLEEVEIKPQISGIIDEIFVEEGADINKGDLIAKVRVVPNEQALTGAKGRVNKAQLQLDNAKTVYDRNQKLFQNGVISQKDMETFELAYNQAKEDVQNAKNDYEIIRRGYTGSGGSANTNIRATTSGMILEIPVKEGYQVIQSNNFNAGTTIASIADMTKMIFEGKVDEAEVGKLEEGSEIQVALGAIDKKKFPAVFDKITEDPYVEVKTGEQEFERKDLELGISDGINVEILSGITNEDEIKIWNKANKKDDNEERN